VYIFKKFIPSSPPLMLRSDLFGALIPFKVQVDLDISDLEGKIDAKVLDGVVIF
jgi:hypothetical protein